MPQVTVFPKDEDGETGDAIFEGDGNRALGLLAEAGSAIEDYERSLDDQEPHPYSYQIELY